MRQLTAVLVLAIAACEPPPDPTGGPAVSISFPPTSDPVATGGPFQVAPDDDGRWRVLVVADITGIEFVNPYVGDPPVKPGEGHWHLLTSETNTISSFTDWAELELDPTFGDGDLVVLTASVRQNDHEPLEIDGKRVEATIEVELVDELPVAAE